MPRIKTEWWSIYNDAEASVARAMVAEGKLTQIPWSHIPQSHRERNGHKVQIAVVCPREYVREYEHRVRELQA
jgi:hypothetical protein